MTSILKKQLTMLCGLVVLGGALVWSGEASRAQDQSSQRQKLGINAPRVPLSRDAAAKGFVALLESLGDPSSRAQMQDPDPVLMSSFSQSSENDNLGPLLEKMAAQWKQPNQVVNVQSEDDKTATVTVETAPPTAPRPLVLVKEGDGWGVDVFETYAKWNNLQGADKDAALASLTQQYHVIRDQARRASCQTNLKQIALGIAQYTQDYDEKYPLAKPWIDVLQPYVKSEQIFVCPAVTDPQGYGYAYNAKLSSKPMTMLSSMSQTVSVYETTVLKRNAYGMGENRAYRHLGGANYAFADGHVKWMNQTQSPSFNLKP